MVDQAEIHRKANSSRLNDRREAALAIGRAFFHVPDKVQAWQDLHRLTQDEDSDVRWGAVLALGRAFFHVPDKVQAWQDLIRLTQDGGSSVRSGAAFALGPAFSQVPDKLQAWQDLHRLTQDEDSSVRRGAVFALGPAFSQVPDKLQAWQDLHRLTQDENRDVRRGAVFALGPAFSQVPDKVQAWQDLHRLTQDENRDMRWGAAFALGHAFSQVPDKLQAWQDLHRLTQDEDSDVRRGAAFALGHAFSQVPDKLQAWQDLHRLTQDEDSFVRRGAAFALGPAFSQVPDKVQAWQDLHRLTQDEDSSVRRGAAFALGPAFSQVPDKVQAWQDLHRLTQDEDSDVRIYALHSSGKASIFRAIEEEDKGFKRCLEKAIEFFERSSKEKTDYFNPARFCLPFYKSFHAVIFQETRDHTEVDICLAEAKEAVGQSKSKEVLIEAVDSLAQALFNIQRAKSATLEERRLYLSAYERSCESATSLLSQAEECAPGAAETLRRGLPIIDQNLKAILKEIEDDSARLLKATRQTPFEAPGARTQERIKGLSVVGYESNAETIMDEVVPDIRVICAYLPEKRRESVCELRNWEILDFNHKSSLLRRTISHCAAQIEFLSQRIENLEKDAKDKDEWVRYLREEVLARLDNINYHIFKIRIQSANAAQSLRALEYELEKIKKIKADLDRLGQRFEDLGIIQQQALLELQANMPRILEDLEKIAKNQKDPRMRQILDRLETMKKSRIEGFFDRVYFSQIADVISIISFLLYFMPK